MKFLHTADLHLGMKYSTEYPEALRKKLREDEKNIILRIINLASEKSIPYIFICGDLFDTHKPDKDIVDFVISSFESYNGKIFIITGNHDFNGPESVYSVRKFPSNVHIFGNEISVIEEEELYI